MMFLLCVSQMNTRKNEIHSDQPITEASDSGQLKVETMTDKGDHAYSDGVVKEEHVNPCLCADKAITHVTEATLCDTIGQIDIKKKDHQSVVEEFRACVDK